MTKRVSQSDAPLPDGDNINGERHLFNPAPQAIYTFPIIYEACKAKGLKARLYQFDCGQTIEVASMPAGKQLCRITAMCDDETQAADRVAMWLMNYRYLTVLDLANASANAR
jgi:hypothetical protein